MAIALSVHMPCFAKGSIREDILIIKAGDRYYSARHAKNCVAYVRWLTRGRLPFGLHTLADKKKIITSHLPRKGQVAVIHLRNGTGHLAYVLDLDISKTHIRMTLLESNNPRGVIRKRTITARDGDVGHLQSFVRIVGYWEQQLPH